MSKEAIAAFIEGISNDPKLQSELTLLAAKYGYDFSADELNDADLAEIAGGVMNMPPMPMAAKKKPAKK